MKRHLTQAVRAGVYQLLGAALLSPVAAALGLLILTALTPGRVLVLWAACLPASVLLAMLPLTRRLEVAALSDLLDVVVPERGDRLYLVALTSLHLYVGATLSAAVLALSPGLLPRAWRTPPVRWPRCCCSPPSCWPRWSPRVSASAGPRAGCCAQSRPS
ncbi:hypothetical protein ACFMQL_26325 [Nonomuraea fastidiosa]|uniref:hypothetical protein n=1 Tax=Nonomuraea fastidiosa TaxID=46173 RepID=UPI00366E62DE